MNEIPESLQERKMSPREYERTIANLRMNQSQAARWLGVSERTGRRYIAGEAEVPPSQVILLRLAAHTRLRPIVPGRRKRHY